MIPTAVDLQLVVLVGVAVGVLGALWTFAGAKDAYGSIGKGYLEPPTPEETCGGFGSWNGEVAADASQLIEARSRLRVRHGKSPLDPVAELRALLRELER